MYIRCLTNILIQSGNIFVNHFGGPILTFKINTKIYMQKISVEAYLLNYKKFKFVLNEEK